MSTTMSGGRRRVSPGAFLVLAFQSTAATILLLNLLSVAQTEAIQSADQVAAGADLSHSNAPLMTLGSESSSALEASAALAGDDLIAAESSQSPSDQQAAEHKAFTSGQMLRQENQQQQMAAASVAPVFAAPPQQPQQQQQQPQQQQPQQQQPPQAAFFNGQLHPQHMMAQGRVPHLPPPQQQRAPPKGFNSFMAAALAGNYGPAQQQIAAAAAAASLQAQQSRQQPQLPVGPMVPPPQMHHHQQQQQPPHSQHQHPHLPQQQPQPQPQPQPQVMRQPEVVAAQESSVRQNVVAAGPNYSSMVDSNSIEMSGGSNGQQPEVAAAQSSGNTQLAVASSAQHPVIAPASGGVGSMQESGAGAWPLQAPEIPKIVNLEVKCEKNLMKVSIEFDKIFNGVIFSKGHYNQGQCLHVGQNSGKQQAYFDISINSCGTQGNTQNGLYGMGGNTGSGTYFENTIVIQYDPNVQEVYDHARKLRCTWHDQYEKAVTFRPFPVDMLDIVRADFAGDNVGCWMQIQVGKGPWASEVAGIVKIGQTMTMVLAIKDEENKFDMLVRNCFAHDGKRGPIELVDKSGCITRPKLMSRFTKIKNFGSSATVLSYAHFQAFKFPDSMEVHFQCTIQICRHQCPEQCSSASSSGQPLLGGGAGGSGEAYSESTISGTFNIGAGQQQQQSAGATPHLRKFGSAAAASLSRERRHAHSDSDPQQDADLMPETSAGHHWTGNGSHHHHKQQRRFGIVGLNRVIQVVSTGDLAFSVQQQQQQVVNGSVGPQSGDQLPEASSATRVDLGQQICMSSYSFVLSLVVLVLILLCSSLVAVSLYLRQRSLTRFKGKLQSGNKQLIGGSCGSSITQSSCSSSPDSTMRKSSSQAAEADSPYNQVPRSQLYQQQQTINHQLQQQLMFEAQARGH